MHPVPASWVTPASLLSWLVRRVSYVNSLLESSSITDEGEQIPAWLLLRNEWSEACASEAAVILTLSIIYSRSGSYVAFVSLALVYLHCNYSRHTEWVCIQLVTPHVLSCTPCFYGNEHVCTKCEMTVHLVIGETFHAQHQMATLWQHGWKRWVMDKVSRTHFLRTMNVCNKCQSNPIETNVMDWPTDRRCHL